MKGNSCPYYNIFHGIVYCATCGKSMQVRYEKVGRTNKDRRTGKEREPIDKAYYICQTYNQNRMQEIAAIISEEEHSEGDVRTFMEEIKRYAAITELDETVLNRLINRILIGKPEKIDGVRTQEVRIVYNFVGEL